MPTDEGHDDQMKNMEEQKEAILKAQMGESAEAKESQYEPLTDFKVKAQHTVAGGENLSAISEKYYKTAANWVYIYRANMDVIGDNPNVIQPGMDLKIPVL